MEYIERWKPIDRVSHWLLIISFLIGFITGLPVFDNSLFGWLVPLVGGTDIRKFLHNWVMIPLLGIVIILQIVKFAKQKGTEVFPTGKDIKDMLTLLKRNLGLNVEEPELGFHHPAEKFVFLAAFISVIIFSITGPIMVFNIGGPSLFLWSRLLHSLAAMLMLIVLAGHFFTAISPANWPVLRAMLKDGLVNKKWAMKHSKLWAEQVLEVKATQ